MTTPNTNPLAVGFCEGVRPPTPIEEIGIFCREALKDIANESRPERDRINSAIRLLCSIRFIGDRLPEGALNDIYGRAGVMPPGSKF